MTYLKLVTHGKDRNEALHRMASALDQYLIKGRHTFRRKKSLLFLIGVKHNVPILRAILTHPRFVSGDITTNFIAEEYPEGFSGSFLIIPIACMLIFYISVSRNSVDRNTREGAHSNCLSCSHSPAMEGSANSKY